MANPYFTSDTLIESVKRRAMIPESQSTFTDDDLLAFANEEISLGMVPYIMSMQEEYFIFRQNEDLVANTSNYAIPYRAIGNKLRDLFYEDEQGNLREMTQISPDDRAFYGTNSNLNSFAMFYLQGSEIFLIPEASATVTGSLQFVYPLKPNQLVSEDRIGVISAINTSTGVITVDAVPDNITTGSLVDFLQTKAGHKTYAFDITVVGTNPSLNTITVAAADIPSGLSIGDHIASQNECMIAQIPDDLHVILAQRVACRALESMGDSQGLQNANAKLAEMEQKAGMLVDNRVIGASKKLVNNKGLLRGSGLRRRGGSW